METKIIKSLPLFLLLLLLLGCVYYDTEDGGIKITISGVSVDGKIKWEEKSLRLNRDCRKVQFVKSADGPPEILVN